ncbi:MAG: 50S ribosomal protein L10 [Erysipelotrichaceae bacterium]|jgi:large subunit ribosomal protein L10|nr:50S ribosomal protein L10 [Erysipelotrichaceae bacterium]
MNQRILKEKELVVSNIVQDIDDGMSLVILTYRGLTVAKISDLRRQLRAKDARMVVLKNSLVKRALDKKSIAVTTEVIEGPNAYVFAKNPFSVLGTLNSFARKNDLSLKAAIIEGGVADKETLKGLQGVTSKEGLYAMLLSVLQAPLRNLAYVLNSEEVKKSAK